MQPTTSPPVEAENHHSIGPNNPLGSQANESSDTPVQTMLPAQLSATR